MNKKVAFAPQLIIKHGVHDVSFYSKAFGANELRRFSNDDGSIHVAELEIGGALFHIHEEVLKSGSVDPQKYGATTVILGLFVPDVDHIMETAKSAGATVISPAQDYDYGYRQGQLKDPFGHLWLIEKKISI